MVGAAAARLVLALACMAAPCMVGEAHAQDAELDAVYARIAADADGPLRVRIYVALCDNDSQGIVPVKNRAICDGERPERNIYWGTSGGLRGYLDHEGWRRVAYQHLDGPVILHATWRKRFWAGGRLRALGRSGTLEVEIEAFAYRGRAIRRAMADYVADVHGAAGAPAPAHVVGYIGHNYFLDTLDDLVPVGPRRDDAQLPRGVFALSCFGEQDIRPSITRDDAPVLVLNRSLTYPGAWTVGGLVRALAGGRPARGVHHLATEHFTAGKGRPVGTMRGVFSYGAPTRAAVP